MTIVNKFSLSNSITEQESDDHTKPYSLNENNSVRSQDEVLLWT